MTAEVAAPPHPPLNVRSGPQMREYRSIVERVAQDAPVRVLDWGCGYGQVSQMLRDVGVAVTPLEYRPGVETEGFAEYPWYPGVLVYLTADPVRLPFDADSFDAVISCGVLEHVVDPDASLEEIRRILRSGGRFYVFKLPNRFSYVEAVARLVGAYHHGCGPHDRLYDRRSAVQLLERHGLAVHEFRRANMLPLNRSGVLLPWAAAAIWRANQALSRLPLLNVIATNLELVAVAP